jgi:hypothetical protein
MKKSQLTLTGQHKLEAMLQLETESWNWCRHWWEPADKSGTAVQEMRHWNAAFERFKAKIEGDEDLEISFREWYAENKRIEINQVPEILNTFSSNINVPELRFLEAFDFAKRELEISQNAEKEIRELTAA